MELIELQLSIKSINTLQKLNVWLLGDIIAKMRSNPTEMTLALAKINRIDFAVITEAIRKRTQIDLDN